MKIEIQTNKDRANKLKKKAKFAVWQNSINFTDKEKKTSFDYSQLHNKVTEDQVKWETKKRKSKKSFKKENGFKRTIKRIIENKNFKIVAIIILLVILILDIFVSGRVYQAKKDLKDFKALKDKYEILQNEFEYYKEHSWTLSSYDENEISIK